MRSDAAGNISDASISNEAVDIVESITADCCVVVRALRECLVAVAGSTGVTLSCLKLTRILTASSW